MENDTPMSRAVIGGGLSLLFAITAYSMTDNPGGGLVGAATDLGVAIVFLQNSNRLAAIHSDFANIV